MKEYVEEVRGVVFPDQDKYCYHMVGVENKKLIKLMNGKTR